MIRIKNENLPDLKFMWNGARGVQVWHSGTEIDYITVGMGDGPATRAEVQAAVNRYGKDEADASS